MKTAIKKISKFLKWDTRTTAEKVLIVIIGLVVFPLAILGLVFLLSRKEVGTDLENDKYHHRQQKKHIAKAKEQMDKAKAKTKVLLIKRQEELEEITSTNEEASNIITDISRASTPDQLESLRRRIDSLGK